MADALSQLDNLAPRGTPPPKPDDGFNKNEPKPPPGKEAQEADDEPAKAEPAKEEKPEAPEKPEKAKADPAKETPKETNVRRMAKEYEATKAKIAAYEKELAELKSKPANDPEKEALNKKLETLEKRYKETDDELRFARYESHPEYKENFEKPFHEAYMAGQNKVANLKVIERKNDLDEITQAGRQSTKEDFDRLMRFTDDDQAAAFAEEMWGGVKATIALQHRELVLMKNADREKAIETYRKEGHTREAARREQHEKFVKDMGALYNKERDEAVAKYPKLFAPIEGDEHGNSLLEKGFRDADDTMDGMITTEDGQRRRMTPQENARRQAMIRNKAGNHDRLWHLNMQKAKQIKELSEKLKQYEESEPGPGDGKGKGGAGGEVSGRPTMEKAWAELDKRAR